MKIVQGDTLKADARSSHRGGIVSYLRLLDGETDRIDNFSLVLARTPGRYSPRHRHNFEQFRYQIEGTANYGRTGKLKPGMIGYFPEGVHYGPQTQADGDQLAMLVLQCGGASGAGYLGREGEVYWAEDLKKYGQFKDGVFKRNPGLPGKKNLDAFQAIWEHANQRPLVYPKARYDVPILMHPDGFDWVAVKGAAGVFEKTLGVFTERNTGASFIKIEAGASYATTGRRDIYFILSGSGSIGGEPLRKLTTIFLDKGDKASLTAKETIEIVHYRMPDLAGVQSLKPSMPAQAAE
jgi:mannose-6-phosphate isomerase-like protein (cupin superfamily)